MKLDRKKLKKAGKEIVWSGKETVKMTVPIYPAIVAYETGHPEVGAALQAGVLPWVGGYTAYHYIKGRKLKKQEQKRK